MNPKYKILMWQIVIKVVLIAAAVIGALLVVKYWYAEKSTGRSSNPSVLGRIIGVPETLEERVQAESYDIGREEGLDSRGIHVVSLDELRAIADRGIRKYSRYVGDPNFQDPSEEDPQQGGVQQQNAPSQQDAVQPSQQQQIIQQSIARPQVQQQPGARVILQQNLRPQPPAQAQKAPPAQQPQPQPKPAAKAAPPATSATAPKK